MKIISKLIAMCIVTLAYTDVYALENSLDKYNKPTKRMYDMPVASGFIKEYDETTKAKDFKDIEVVIPKEIFNIKREYSLVFPFAYIERPDVWINDQKISFDDMFFNSTDSLWLSQKDSGYINIDNFIGDKRLTADRGYNLPLKQGKNTIQVKIKSYTIEKQNKTLNQIINSEYQQKYLEKDGKPKHPFFGIYMTDKQYNSTIEPSDRSSYNGIKKTANDVKDFFYWENTNTDKMPKTQTLKSTVDLDKKFFESLDYKNLNIKVVSSFSI